MSWLDKRLAKWLEDLHDHISVGAKIAVRVWMQMDLLDFDAYGNFISQADSIWKRKVAVSKTTIWSE